MSLKSIKNKLLVAITLSFVTIVLIFTQYGCEGACTAMYCEDGVNVVLNIDLIEKNMQAENFVLKWSTETKSGEVKADDFGGDRSRVRFYICRDGDGVPSSSKDIQVELRYLDEVYVPLDSYSLNWVTSVCNECGGLKGDEKVTNAGIVLPDLQLP